MNTLSTVTWALDEVARPTALPLGLSTPRDPQLLRAFAVLRANPADLRRLEELADLAGASSRTLARLFRAETGLSFSQWRQQARMAEALGALSTGVTPARAAAVAGFAGQAAFGAAFRGSFGMTPGQARQPLAMGRDPIHAEADRPHHSTRYLEPSSLVGRPGRA